MCSEKDLPVDDKIGYASYRVRYLDVRDKESKFAFISIMNRDIRTPLAGI